MAFVSRAERQPVIGGKTCTPATVGPGSYEAKPSVVTKGPSLAPFSTTAARGFDTSLSERPPSPSHAGGSGAGTGRAASDRRHSSTGVGSSSGSSQAQSRDRWLPASQQQCWRHASSSFAGGKDRFGSSATASPGPAAYKPDVSWIKRQSLIQSASGSSSSHQPGLNLARPTPPSIPCLHDSHGYETADDGQLVRQPAPAPTPSAADAISGRPKSSSLARGPGWSKSKAAQHPASPAAAATASSSSGEGATPGPGSYNVNSTAGNRTVVGTDGRGWRRVKVPSSADGAAGGAASGSSSFASKTLREHQKAVDQVAAGLGPGSYTPDISQDPRPATAPVPGTGCFMPWQQQPVPADKQLWSRFSSRESGPSVFCSSSGAAEGPGPGAYTPGQPQDAFKRRQQRPKPSSVFRSEVERFDSGGYSKPIPGPGEYASDTITSLSHRVQVQAAVNSCTKGAFGSAGVRFQHEKQQQHQQHSPLGAAAAAVAAVLGPNSAQGRTPRGQSTSRKAESPSRQNAVFASATDRFKAETAAVAQPDYSGWDQTQDSLKGDVTRLGPGAYLGLDDWARKAKRGHGSRSSSGGIAAFGSSSQQAHVGVRREGVAAVPGPGAYNAAVNLKQAFTPLTRPSASNAGFASAANRFKMEKTAAPGPGAYSPAAVTRGASSQLAAAQKTFNVTYLS